MKSQAADLASVREALEALQAEIRRLNERVATLESQAVSPASAGPVVPAESAELNPDLVLVISAAIAAFLGVKPRIRQIRVLRSDAWAQQGRATVQASHAFPRLHG